MLLGPSRHVFYALEPQPCPDPVVNLARFFGHSMQREPAYYFPPRTVALIFQEAIEVDSRLRRCSRLIYNLFKQFLKNMLPACPAKLLPMSICLGKK